MVWHCSVLSMVWHCSVLSMVWHCSVLSMVWHAVCCLWFYTAVYCLWFDTAVYCLWFDTAVCCLWFEHKYWSLLSREFNVKLILRRTLCDLNIDTAAYNRCRTCLRFYRGASSDELNEQEVSGIAMEMSRRKCLQHFKEEEEKKALWAGSPRGVSAKYWSSADAEVTVPLAKCPAR